MDYREQHDLKPSVTFDGGSMDCGNGLLLLIRKHMDPLAPGQLLEILSTESSVEEDLPAWCRLTGNSLVSRATIGDRKSFLVCKGLYDEATQNLQSKSSRADKKVFLPEIKPVEISIPTSFPPIREASPVAPLSVTGIGSWPRPSWLMRSMHEWLAGRMSEQEFQSHADDAIRLSVEAQLRAGIDMVTDGEQRRDNYASFVGQRLDNCVLIPLTDLLPLVDDPEKFREEMQSLDVPADQVRHPAIFGKIGRSKSLAVHEYEFVRSITDKPVKIALPGPYLLSRTMWMECISDRVYAARDDLARDIVRVLREEIHFLLAAGVNLVQLDEPVLTEVVFGGATSSRSFMCGALSERADTAEELDFAAALLNDTVRGFPRDRLSMHICRGNWTPDESLALKGSYVPLVPLFRKIDIGTLFLEFCTDRAGELSVLKEIPEQVRVGLGVVNPKDPAVESAQDIARRAQEATNIIGADRLLLNPDCGFATFADNPVSSTSVAEAKLASMVAAAKLLRRH